MAIILTPENTNSSETQNWSRIESLGKDVTAQEDRKKTEDWYHWDRYSRLVYRSDLSAMTTADLEDLWEDIGIDITSLGTGIDDDMSLIESCTGLQLAQQQAFATRRRRKILIRDIRKRFRRYVGGEIRSRGVEKPEECRQHALAKTDLTQSPKPTKKPKKQKKYKVDPLLHQTIRKKHDQLARAYLMKRLVDIIGEFAFDALAVESELLIREEFKLWAIREAGAVIEEVEKVIVDCEKGRLKKLRSIGFDSLESFIDAHSPKGGQHLRVPNREN